MQDDAVGSVIQLLNTVTSLVIPVQVELSHLPANTAGRDPAVLYTAVHAEEAGSDRQDFTAARSMLEVETLPTDCGIEPTAP